MADSGIVNIRGKEYQTVAKRIADFRVKYPLFAVETDVISAADLVCVKALIKDDNDRVLATGYAEEVRDSTNINKTSALENCETSAVGRALAFFGYGGSEIASANEVNDAIIAGAKKEVADYFLKYNGAISNNLDSVSVVMSAINNNDLELAAGAWYDMSEEDQQTIFGLAPTKGGILTTKHRETIKSSEFRKAYFGESDGE